MPKPLPWQSNVISQARRFCVVDVGRRAGKSTLGLNRCADPTVMRFPVGWFSPTYKMLLEIWREAAQMFEPITKRRSVQERRIELTTGGMLEFWSLDNADVARGRKYKRVIIDEAAMVPNLMDVWQYAIRPTLTDYEGDAWFLSTPRGHNAFWQMWQWGNDPDMPEWASWQMPSSVNPKLPRAELDELLRTLPERIYQQEILAAFLADGAGVFRGITNAATAIQQAGPQPNATYVAGLDWALSVDFTVLTIMDAATQSVTYIDRFNGVDYSLQRQRIKAACERFGVTVVLAEENAMGKPNNDELRKMGLHVRDFTTTNTSKAEIIEKLAAGFEQGNIKIINDPILIAELQSYGAERLPGGQTRYGAPSGMHDDCVMSLALAWYGAVKPRRSNSMA